MAARTFLLMVLSIWLQAESGAQAVVQKPSYFFPKTVAGTVIEHEYVIENAGTTPLRIRKADMTLPLRPTKLPAVVAPGEQAVTRFRLDTTNLAGIYEGRIVLATDASDQPEINLSFEGEIVPTVEFRPMPAFFVSVQRGESKTASLEIINHRQQPLTIVGVESPSSRFSVQLETLTPGTHYRLALTTRPDAAPGKVTEMITLSTSDPERPVLKVQANTLVRERVYTFPEQLDFGLLQPGKLQGNMELLSSVSQPLMVYQTGDKDFQITVRSDVPFLDLHAVRSELGDRYHIEVSVIPEKMEAGRASGTVVIETNDPNFPEIRVPVQALIE